MSQRQKQEQRRIVIVRTWLDGIVQNLIDRLDVLVRGGVQNNDDGTDEANGTAQLAQRAELFIQKV